MSGILSLAEDLQQKSKDEAERIKLQMQKDLEGLRSAIYTDLKGVEKILKSDIELSAIALQRAYQKKIEEITESFAHYQNQAEISLNQSLQGVQKLSQQNEKRIAEILEQNSKLTTLSIFRTWLIPLGFVLVIFVGLMLGTIYLAYDLKETYSEISRAERNLEMLQKSGEDLKITQTKES